MQEALKNPHYKKIWEKIIMNRHPKAKSLEEALEMELQFYGCHFINHNATMAIGTIVGWNDGDFKYISTEGINEKKQSFVLHIRDKMYQKSSIVGRPITLEDILILLNKNVKINLLHGGKALLIFVGKYVFEWKPTKPLHEQTPETWEKIAK